MLVTKLILTNLIFTAQCFYVGYHVDNELVTTLFLSWLAYLCCISSHANHLLRVARLCVCFCTISRDGFILFTARLLSVATLTCYKLLIRCNKAGGCCNVWQLGNLAASLIGTWRVPKAFVGQKIPLPSLLCILAARRPQNYTWEQQLRYRSNN